MSHDEQQFINYSLDFLTMVLVPAEISVPVSCDFSLSSCLSPILGSSLPCDLDSLMDLRVIYRSSVCSAFFFLCQWERRHPSSLCARPGNQKSRYMFLVLRFLLKNIYIYLYKSLKNIYSHSCLKFSVVSITVAIFFCRFLNIFYKALFC